jgi:nucleoid-associated protein YgaU
VSPTTEARRYTVAKGDSLAKIASRFYGDRSQWRQIYEANRKVIGDDPAVIKPGQKLTIP